MKMAQVARMQEDVAAVFLDGAAAAPSPDLIGGNAAQVAAQRPEDASDPDLRHGIARAQTEEGELALVGQVAGEGHDDFAGQRNAGAFDGHEQHDAQGAHGGHDGQHPGDDGGEELLQHQGLPSDWE